eukprot:c18306_g1_i1.p1 GENE.c18306_g1_i1~~c18306_g1_i1.p1  ORF type:complete len:301 (-),score=94.38 c18306_g1_i1:171-1073(-)
MKSILIKDVEVYEHQVAGHGGILFHPDHTKILKPAIPKEMTLYENVFLTQESHILSPYIPSFYGVECIDHNCFPSSEEKEIELKYQCKEKPIPNRYIVLENLFYGFSKPSILDIKMGTSLYGETADEQKKLRAIQKAKSSTSEKLGFRICGLKVFQNNCGEYLTRDKSFGRALNESNVYDAFRLFFFDGKQFKYEIISNFLSSLEDLLQVISTLTNYQFIASSLLLFYESIPGTNLDTTPRFGVRLIDFGKTNIIQSPQDNQMAVADVGFILGLKNIIQSLKKIQNEFLFPKKKNEGVEL